jgi:hypothetical protein
MTPSPQENDKLICPKCKVSNGLKAEYCWACYFDFVPNTAPKPSKSPELKSKRMSPTATFFSQIGFYALMVFFSFIIVYGSWLLYRGFTPKSAKLFFTGWTILLFLTWLSERHLPDPESDMSEYWSINPFNYKDNYNWFILKWHIVLFLPRVVWATMKLTYWHATQLFKIKDSNNLLK